MLYREMPVVTVWDECAGLGILGGCFLFLLLPLHSAVGFCFGGEEWTGLQARVNSQLYLPQACSVTSFLLMQDNLILTFKKWYRNRFLKTNAGEREASAEVRLDAYNRS